MTMIKIIDRYIKILDETLLFLFFRSLLETIYLCRFVVYVLLLFLRVCRHLVNEKMMTT